MCCTQHATSVRCAPCLLSRHPVIFRPYTTWVTMVKSSAHPFPEPTQTPADSACAAADALLRAAAECVRQHDRLGRCLENVCSDDEMMHLAEVNALTDTHLERMTDAYERIATAAPEARSETWWHAANTLWHAAREYARRSAGTDRAQRLAGKHSREKLAELQMEFELERSALMALKQAVADVKTARAEAA